MRITDSFIVQAPQAEVWDFLFDIPRMSRCIPGIESVEVVDDRTYRGRLVVRVGPIRSEFTGLVLLSEVRPPDYLAGTVEGDDRSNASSMRAGFSGRLEPMESGVKAAFEVEVNLRGRLAQFGGAVIQATAKKLTAEFARNVKAELEH